MTEAIHDAMRQGGIKPEDIDYINAHGSGTKQNDRHETAAYKKALGEHAYEIPISSIKSMIGHSLGAIGAIEMAACALAIDRGVVPPTANWENPDPECDLDYTPQEARRKQRRRGAVDRQRLRRLPVGDDLRPAAGAPGGGRRDPALGLQTASRRAVVTGIGVVAPERHRHRRLVEGDAAPARAASSASRASTPPTTPPSSPARSTASRPSDYIEKRLIVQTDRWTHMALAATQMALDDAALDPAEHDPYSMSVITASSLGRQRVRPEGDPGAVGEGPDVRRRLPVDRLVLRRHHRPDLDPAQDEGPLRRGDRRGRRRAGGAPALPAHDPPRRRHDRQRRARGADRALRAHLPAAQREPEHASPIPAAAYRPFDVRANGYVPGRGRRDPDRRGPGERRASAARRRSTARSPATAPRTTPTTRGDPAPDGAPARARDPRGARRTRASSRTRWTWCSPTRPGSPRPTPPRRRRSSEVFGERAGELPVTAPKTMVGRLYAGGAALDVARRAAGDARRRASRRRSTSTSRPRGATCDFVTGSARAGRAEHGAGERARLRRLQQRARPAPRCRDGVDSLLQRRHRAASRSPAALIHGDEECSTTASSTPPSDAARRARHASSRGRGERVVAHRAERARARRRPVRRAGARRRRGAAERPPARVRAAPGAGDAEPAAWSRWPPTAAFASAS